MKRIFALIAVLVLTAGVFVGCGGDRNETTAPATTNATTTAPSESTLPPTTGANIMPTLESILPTMESTGDGTDGTTDTTGETGDTGTTGSSESRSRGRMNRGY